jgi:flavin-dependent trigonelline monooxygenase, reductase component
MAATSTADAISTASVSHAIEPRALRQAFGCFATGVTIVTACDELGQPRGMTANSFTSVSLTPPLILVCVATDAPIWPTFATAESFAVNVLANGQQALSQGFARPALDKFAGIDWRPGGLGAPILDGVAAHLECRRVREITAGDHMILLGEVIGFAHAPVLPLIFHRGGYAALAH